ncbi:MAG TPA: CocE/NonD family hydrolase [Anaerolineales bacterium]
MTLLARQALARLLGLPRAKNTVTVQRDLPITMSDGLVLVGDLYSPNSQGDFPTILIRSTWGRGWDKAPFSLLYRFIAQRFAEQGFHVFLQDTHQRLPSSDDHPMPHSFEARDGKDTLRWIARQPWFNGRLGMWGASYLGYVQWAAVLGNAVPDFRALAVVPVTIATRWSTVLYPDGAFALDTAFRLQYLLAVSQLPFHKMLVRLMKQESVIACAISHLPLSEAARLLPLARGSGLDALGQHTDVDGHFWHAVDFREQLANNPARVHLIAGWYDLFLREQLDDYLALKRAGQDPCLTIGPWHHTDPRLAIYSLREARVWFDAHLRGETAKLRYAPVRIFLMGADQWRELDAWPPESQSVVFYLHPLEALSRTSPGDDLPPDEYVYDPADPTPSIGGAVINPRPGRQDNRTLEARRDVLCYTSPLLGEDLEIIGAPLLTLFVHSSSAHTDYFGRLCAVDPNGLSRNVTDGLLRVEPGVGARREDGVLKIEIPLWPTAFRFKKGQRIRLQVSSGAHARWSRNLGTGEPAHTATRLLASHNAIYHDRERASALLLPSVP